MPERGYHLELITAGAAAPQAHRRPAAAAAAGARAPSGETRAVLDDVDADVVVGFGGYVALPAYLAARGRRPRCRSSIHEANASAGLANQVGARSARRVLAAVPDSGLRRRRGGRRAGARGDHRAGPGGAAGARRARTSDSPTTRRCCWCSAARRARSRSTGLSRPPPTSSPRPGSRCCTRTARRTPSTCAQPTPRRPAVRRGAVPRPDGPGLRRRRPGDLPVRAR